jgi:uncharacterized protein (TIGR00369 family)
MTDTKLSPPEGFRLIKAGGPYMSLSGPLYGRIVQENNKNRVQIGFRVEQRHTNPVGICHGGMLATLADMLAIVCLPYQTDLPRHFLPTISLQLDYLAPAPMDAWVQAQADILRTTRNLIFTQGLITANGENAMRTSAIYKIGQRFESEDANSKDPFGLL